jgi:palmitoyl-protein thioesterase
VLRGCAPQDTELYKRDWIGLRQLDQDGRLELREVPGGHMHFTLDWFDEEIVDKYLRVDLGVGDGVLDQ